LDRAAPSTPYTITAAFLFHGRISENPMVALCWTDGTQVETVGFRPNASIPEAIWRKYTSATVFSANRNNYTVMLFGPCVWLRIVDDGTSRYGYVSSTGRQWTLITNTTRTDFLTPTTVGFCIDGGSSATQMTMGALLSWAVT
jgi:hypothetical protein